MNNDESELQRLLGQLAKVASSLAPAAVEREGLSKAMLALVFLFAEGWRTDLESAYIEVGGMKPQAPEDLLFDLKNPEFWVRTLGEFPELKEQVLSKEHEADTVGGFLKQQVDEVELRRTSENVSRFRKPD
jgi:hypothetical protein